METIFIVILVILLDLLIVFIFEKNSEWIFLAILAGLSIIIPIHLVNFNEISMKKIYEVRGLWTYDICLVVCVVYMVYVLPEIYESMLTNMGPSNGAQFFYYLYPVLEIFIE
jgi:hypothetical protein